MLLKIINVSNLASLIFIYNRVFIESRASGLTNLALAQHRWDAFVAFSSSLRSRPTPDWHSYNDDNLLSANHQLSAH